MDTLEAIHTRRSIRKYEDKPVAEEAVEELLRAAMTAPSARNAQPWHFVIFDERELLQKVSKINANAYMAAEAPLAILVCGDLSLEKSAGYWPQDCAAAVENMLLAAHAMGLGAVWTGIHPRPKREKGFRELLDLPENIMPHSMIVIGHPAEPSARQDRYKADRVRKNGW
jgi:nitroreductase